MPLSHSPGHGPGGLRRSDGGDRRRVTRRSTSLPSTFPTVMVALLRPIRRRRPKHSAMATTRRLPSSAASPDPSCTTTPSWRLPGSWAMGSGSERASSRSFSPTICSRTGSAGRARATTRARSRDWSASSGTNFLVPVPRAESFAALNDALVEQCRNGARRRGCGATRRPSASVSSGIVKFSCHCRLLPMMPAISALDGRSSLSLVRYRSNDYSVPWPTATVRCSSGATSMRW